MDANLEAQGFDNLVGAALRALKSTAEPEGEAPARAEGTADDGRVRATVVAGGRLAAVRIDPRAMKLGSETLGEQIVIAVNAALDELHAAPASPGEGDPAAHLRRIQDEAVLRLDVFTKAVEDALARVEAR